MPFLLSRELLEEVLSADKLEQGAVIQERKASHSTKIIKSLSSFPSPSLRKSIPLAMGFVCPPRRCQSANPLYLWMWPYFSMVFVGDWVDMRSLGWVLIQCDWCSYKKGMFRSRDRHALRDFQPDVAESRGQSDVPTAWGMPTVTSTPPDVRREGKVRFSPASLRGNQDWQHLDLRLLASRTVRLQCPPVCGTCYVALVH